MKLTWYGHGAFGVESEAGIRILMDPYLPGAFDGRIAHGPIPGPFDVVTISHEHVDHSHLTPDFGDPEVLRGSGTAHGIEFLALHAFHDELSGELMGQVRIFVFETDGIRIAHLADLGHRLTPTLLESMGKIDLLLLPIGGIFTINPGVAVQIMHDVGAAITVPMHFRNFRCHLDIAFLDQFLELCSEFTLHDSSDMLISSDTLGDPTICVLRPAL